MELSSQIRSQRLEHGLSQDDLAEAKDAVETARRNLFTAYRTYYWAVNYGVTSSGQSGT